MVKISQTAKSMSAFCEEAKDHLEEFLENPTPQP